MKIEVIASSEGVTVCAVYPAPPGKQNSCERGENWSSHTNNNDVQVRFTVRVPRGVKFEARNVNGEVRASGLTAPATLETVNGGVQLETTSYGSASTVNGSVMARIGSAQWPGSLEFKSVNGSIDVTLPAGTGARVEGSTMNGQIETDFPITVRGKVNGRSLEGTIGNGKSEISLESLNGSVRLHSAS